MAEVSDNANELRYELRGGDTLIGFINYRDEPDRRVLVHTDIDPKYEGGGYGSQLVKAALDDVRARGIKIVPLCPFVAAFLRRHPDYGDVVFHG